MLQLTTVLFLTSFTVLATLHYLLLRLFLYWRLPWIDIPMHFFGGIVVALGIFTLADLRIVPRTWLSVVLVLCGVVVVAVAWEVFEYGITTTLQPGYIADTCTDLVLGMFGGLVGWFIGSRMHALR